MISLELPPLSETGRTKQQRSKRPLVNASRISLHAVPPETTSTLGRAGVTVSAIPYGRAKKPAASLANDDVVTFKNCSGYYPLLCPSQFVDKSRLLLLSIHDLE